MITVMRDRYVRSWPGDGARTYQLDVGRALARRYSTDAHLVQYTSAIGRRLSRAALAAGAVARISVIALDIDCGAAHATGGETPSAWRADVRTRLHAIDRRHPGGIYYWTRGGCRVMYRLPAESAIASADDGAQWSTDYLVTCAYMRRAFGLVCDVACADWTRLFRLPRTRRDGVDTELGIVGDLGRLGVLAFAPYPSDVASAEAHRRPATTWTAPMATHDGTVGHGALHEALLARGDVGRAHKGGWLIRCPNEAAHTGGRTGDGSTLLYPADRGRALGYIHCLHSHCSGLNVREWARLALTASGV